RPRHCSREWRKACGSAPFAAGQSGEARLFAANLLSPRGEDQGEGEAATEIRVSDKDTARGSAPSPSRCSATGPFLSPRGEEIAGHASPDCPVIAGGRAFQRRDPFL